MTTAVKVHDEAKSRLEELQAAIRLQTGRTVTQQALLSRLIDDAYKSREAVIESFRESTVLLSAEEKAAMRRGRFSSGWRPMSRASTTYSTDDRLSRHGRVVCRS